MRAERPQLGMNPQGERLLLFRRFGQAGTNGWLGQLSLAQKRPGGSFGAPMYLTDEASQFWQPALAISKSSGKAFVISQRRLAASSRSTQSLSSMLAPATTSGRPSLKMATLTSGSDPIESRTLEPQPDPALRSTLDLSQQHASLGSTVAVTATVRNLGRGVASGSSVKFYSGTTVTGTLLTTVSLTETLAFNESRRISTNVTSSGQTQLVTAEVTTTGADVDASNNRAAAELGALPPPTIVGVSVSTRHANAIQLTWIPPLVPGVAGYRILRGEAPGGPYELVGEATGTVYSDLLLQPTRNYYYVVQAYDANGVVSEYSAEASRGMTPYKVFLPVTTRQ